MKREKRLTKREQKALRGPRGPAASQGAHAHDEHIHCVACGRHLAPQEFEGTGATATRLRCQHGGLFASCVECASQTRALLDTHDRTGQPVQQAPAWH